jgi:hypothetical protein
VHKQSSTLRLEFDSPLKALLPILPRRAFGWW